MENLKKEKILKVGITTEKKEKILEFITRRLEKKDRKFYIVTPNPEMLVLANKNKDFLTVLNEADIALPDGVGVIMAGKILKQPIASRLTGVDFVADICREVAKRLGTVGFLGGRGKVAEDTAFCLKKMFPNLRVGYAAAEWDKKKLVLPYLDFLFVAFGFPKQEFWIKNNLLKLPVTGAMGVGGAFDYFSGRTPRPPLWVRQAGFEWLYRLIRQPWRIKRQIALLKFMWLVARKKISRQRIGHS